MYFMVLGSAFSVQGSVTPISSFSQTSWSEIRPGDEQARTSQQRGRSGSSLL